MDYSFRLEANGLLYAPFQGQNGTWEGGGEGGREREGKGERKEKSNNTQQHSENSELLYQIFGALWKLSADKFRDLNCPTHIELLQVFFEGCMNTRNLVSDDGITIGQPPLQLLGALLILGHCTTYDLRLSEGLEALTQVLEPLVQHLHGLTNLVSSWVTGQVNKEVGRFVQSSVLLFILSNVLEKFLKKTNENFYFIRRINIDKQD